MWWNLFLHLLVSVQVDSPLSLQGFSSLQVASGFPSVSWNTLAPSPVVSVSLPEAITLVHLSAAPARSSGPEATNPPPGPTNFHGFGPEATDFATIVLRAQRFSDTKAPSRLLLPVGTPGLPLPSPFKESYDLVFQQVSDIAAFVSAVAMGVPAGILKDIREVWQAIAYQCLLMVLSLAVGAGVLISVARCMFYIIAAVVCTLDVIILSIARLVLYAVSLARKNPPHEPEVPAAPCLPTNQSYQELIAQLRRAEYRHGKQAETNAEMAATNSRLLKDKLKKGEIIGELYATIDRKLKQISGFKELVGSLREQVRTLQEQLLKKEKTLSPPPVDLDRVIPEALLPGTILELIKAGVCQPMEPSCHFCRSHFSYLPAEFDSTRLHETHSLESCGFVNVCDKCPGAHYPWVEEPNGQDVTVGWHPDCTAACKGTEPSTLPESEVKKMAFINSQLRHYADKVYNPPPIDFGFDDGFDDLFGGDPNGDGGLGPFPSGGIDPNLLTLDVV